MSESAYSPSTEHERRELAQKAANRENKIKEWETSLCTVGNITDSINDYLKFQDNIDPYIRALMIINASQMVISSLKATAMSFLDIQLMHIDDPPKNIQNVHDGVRKNIEEVGVKLSASLKEIVSTLQGQLIATPKVSGTSIPY